MANLAATLRQEIARLARRECRSQIKGLRRASAQFRRDIAQLKRAASDLRSEAARLKRWAAKEVASPGADADASKVRFRAKGVLSQRQRLGLSAADYGKLVGVTGHTVYKWEHGTSRPRHAQLASLASIRRLGRREARARVDQVRAKTPKKRKSRR